MFLKNDNSLEEFYDNYIPEIIDEALHSIHKDTAAKSILGKRSDRYISILEQSKNIRECLNIISVFSTNIRNILHLFDNQKYYTEVKNQLIYNIIKKWFAEKIDDSTDITTFFESFTFENQQWELIVFVNRKLFSYYDTQLKEIISSDDIELYDCDNNMLNLLIRDNKSFAWLESTLSSLNNISLHVSLVKANVSAYDPYEAYSTLYDFFTTINNLVTMFDNEIKNSYAKIVCLNYPYKTTLMIKRPMEKRLRKYGQDYASRTGEVLRKINMSGKMLNTFLKVLSFHGDALGQNVDNKYILLMLWAALETLFVDNSDKSKGAISVKNSLVEIVQRTYIVKTIKYLQNDLIQHLTYSNKPLIEKYNLNDIDCFINLLFDKEDSERTKEIGATLSRNPLLRTRLYNTIDVNFKSANTVSNYLNLHKQKISWQISRIYRTRNLIVHTGRTVPFIADLVEHLHNYLDYILNYVVCKAENDEAISSIGDIVTEVTMDNELHLSFLNKNKGVMQ